MSRAFDILSRGQTTKKKMIEKLARRGFSEEVIGTTIERLSQMGYIDDDSYAEQWIEQRINARPCGKMLLRKELVGKGIGRDTIDRLLGNGVVYASEMDVATLAGEKWLRRTGGRYAAAELPVKLSAHLRSRGFDFDTISRIVSKLTGTDTE